MVSINNDAILEQLSIMVGETKERLLELDRKRHSIEEEMKLLVEDLRSPRGDNNYIVGLPGEGNLIDPQGFPRNDIDVYEVRTKRHRYACLQTDHKDIMSRLEIELKALHKVQLQREKMSPTISNTEETKSTGVQRTPKELALTASSDTPLPEVTRRPFAKVESVGVDSPADIAGLKIGDEILIFGGEDSRLQGVKKYVEEDKMIQVTVRRGLNTLELNMTPKKWSGRGLLGCYLTPL
jgi:26S proteasome non-ATPase regulatory subunit 9